ncbi:MAG: class I SAM-dependent methyltransferase [Gaiellaceae bacterium]
MTSHDEKIERAFAQQASSFDDPDYGFANPRLLRWILTHIPCEPGDFVLDVAGGTGQLACAYAERAALAVVADVTPEMLAQGKRRVDAEGRRNVVFMHTDAAKLPFLAESFDLVVSRFAVHHFEQPALPIAEMARVCRPGGHVGIVDLVTPGPTSGFRQDHLERLRDPSHVRALDADEIVALLQATGMVVVSRTDRDQAVRIDRWLAQTNAPAEVGDAIRAELQAELAGGAPTGMRPELRDGVLHQTQRWAVFLAQKPAEA